MKNMNGRESYDVTKDNLSSRGIYNIMNSFRNHRLQIHSVSLLIIFVLVASLITLLVTQIGYRTFYRRSTAIPAITLNSPSIATTLKTGKGCGVTKNSDGSYHFSWLHVDRSTGYIVDEQNCIVDLRGFEFPGVEFGDATGGIDQKFLAWINQTFQMNYIRLPLNVQWYNDDIFVPNAHMHYRAWIHQIIQWANADGDYVLLNRVNQYALPPCGGSVSYCPQQSEQAADIVDSNPQQQYNAGHLLDQTFTMWKNIAHLYVNDPAVLYDDWNELHDINNQTWAKVQNQLIKAIRAINPRSLIMLGSNDWNNTMNPLIDHVVPDFPYPNLVYDWHIYNGYSDATCNEPPSGMWTHWGTDSDKQFKWAQTHGHGAVINEWGGCKDYDKYNQALTNYAATHHIAMSYYNIWNVIKVKNGRYTITNNGLKVQRAYAKFLPTKG